MTLSTEEHALTAASTRATGTATRRRLRELMGGAAAACVPLTHELPLDRINEAVDRMRSGESIRTVVEF